MFLSVIASTGEVVIVGVVLGADPSRCTYTLIGSPSGRIGAAVPDGGGIIPMIWPAAIRSVHPPALLSPPWRAQAEGWIGSVITGPIPKSGVSPVWSLINTVVQSAARSEEHTSELQSLAYLVCRLLLEKKKTTSRKRTT